MIQLHSVSEKWLEIFKSKKKSFEVRAFLHCWGCRWDREDLHHPTAGRGLNLHRRSDPGHPTHSQGGFWAHISPPNYLSQLPKGFTIKMISHQQRTANRSVVVRVLKRRLSQLRTEEVVSCVISIPELSAFCSQHQDKRGLHQFPKIFTHCL